jgi:hypothetical protein
MIERIMHFPGKLSTGNLKKSQEVCIGQAGLQPRSSNRDMRLFSMRCGCIGSMIRSSDIQSCNRTGKDASGGVWCWNDCYQGCEAFRTMQQTWQSLPACSWRKTILGHPLVRLRRAGWGNGHPGRGGLPPQANLRRDETVGLADEVLEPALQGQRFSDAGAGRFEGAGIYSSRNA